MAYQTWAHGSPGDYREHEFLSGFARKARRDHRENGRENGKERWGNRQASVPKNDKKCFS